MSIENEILEDFVALCRKANIKVRPNNSLKETGVSFDDDDLMTQQAEEDVRAFLLEEKPVQDVAVLVGRADLEVLDK